LGVELSIRIFFPHSIETEFIERGKTAGIEIASGTHRLRPDTRYRVRVPEYNVLYEINKEGMRDHATYLGWDVDSSKARLLLLGDSFTFGQGVPYDESWGTLLEQGLNSKGRPVEIVKAGIPAYDTRAELEYLIDLYDSYTPNYVIVGFLPNDLFTNQPLVNRLASGDNQLGSLQKKIRERVKQVTRGREKVGPLQIVTLAKRLLLNLDAAYIEIYRRTYRGDYFSVPQVNHIRNQFEITRQLLIQMQNFCVARNVQLIIVSIPEQFQVFYKAWGYSVSGIDVEYIDNFFSALAKQHGFFWITTLKEIAEDYKINKKDYYYRLDGHLNSYGNQMLANIVVHKFGALMGGRRESTKVN
jgi:lysophospholipase L1-like esterase